MTASWHVCSTTPKNTSLLDHVMNVIVLI